MARILGIVNVTRDSFSDGGRFLDPAAAVEHARRIVADGADIVDLGAESTHPDAEAVPAEVEMLRLSPVISTLKSEGVRISVDTCKPAVMRQVLKLGVDFINDVTALEAPGAIEAVRDSTAKLILMHAIRPNAGSVRATGEGPASEMPPAAARTHPANPDGRATRQEIVADRIVAIIIAYFQRRIAELEDAGIPRGRLILDPGMGFFLSSKPEPSLAVLRGLAELRSLACPLLVCTSRKSFLGAVLNDCENPRPTSDRGAGTLASELWAAAQGVQYIRTHDVRALRDGLCIWSAIQNAGVAPFGDGASKRCDSRA